jgi:hypothetical protein
VLLRVETKELRIDQARKKRAWTHATQRVGEHAEEDLDANVIHAPSARSIDLSRARADGPTA